MSSSDTRSKREKEFRLWLKQEIPKFPNDKTTLQIFEKMTTTDQIIAYMNWRARYVTQRPRSVTIEKTVSLDPRWQALSPNINSLLSKVKAGVDLTPHLSTDIRYGFTPPATARVHDADAWADKDLILNVMGFHHFHLGRIMVNGHIDRTNEVLFAFVSRDDFEVLGIFNHDVFKTNSPNPMAVERKRLWNLYEDRLARRAAPGSLLVGSGIALSGHALPVVQAALRCVKRIRQLDSKLNQSAYIQNLYKSLNLPAPAKATLLWRLWHLDFGLFAPKENQFLTLEKWPN